MSFILRDATTVPRAIHNRNIVSYNRFKDFWGTEVVDGIEVFNKKENFYVNGYLTDDKTKRFVKSIGLKWDTFISNSIDSEIETMYFTLNDDYEWSGKTVVGDNLFATEPKVIPTTSMMANSINYQFKVDDEIEVTVSYGGALKRYIKEHSLEWTIEDGNLIVGEFDSTAVREELLSNPWYYMANSRHIEFEPNIIEFDSYNGSTSVEKEFFSKKSLALPACDVSCTIGSLGIFALMGTDSFELVPDSLTEIIGSVDTTSGTALEYRFTQKYKFKETTAQSILIKQMDEWLNQYTVDLNTIEGVDSKTSSTLDTKFKKYLAGYMYRPYTDNVNSMYYGSRIKVSAVEKMYKRDFVQFLGKAIDTDYSVEDKEDWEDVAAVVIVILAIVVFVWTGGASAGFTWAAMGAIGTSLSLASLTIVIGSMALAEAGGLSSAGNVRILGTIAEYVGYAAMMAGFASMYNDALKNIAKKQVEDRLVEEVSSEVLQEMVKQEMAEVAITDVVMEMAKQSMSAVTNLFTDTANLTVLKVVSGVTEMLNIVNMGYKVYIDEEQSKMSKELEKIAEEEEEYNQAILNRKYMNAEAIYSVTNERLSTPDALQDLAIEIEGRIGADSNFNAWKTNVS